MADLLTRLSNAIDHATKIFMQVALAVIVILILSEVVARNVFTHSLTWVEEVAITYLGTWFIFIGAAHAMKVGMLVSFEFFVHKLGHRGATVAFVITQLSTLIFLTVVFVYGTKLSMFSMSVPSPALQLPMGLAYLGIVIGSAMMAVHTVATIVQRFVGKART